MSNFNIALLPGDGIGPEVVAEGVKVLDAVGARFGHEFSYTADIVGGAAIDDYGVALRDETLEMCQEQDAVFFGAVGGPKWDDPGASVRPEQAILGLRKGLGLFANIRPVKMYDFLVDSTALKPEVVRGVDMIVLRELTGGIYFGQPQKQWVENGERHVVDTLAYSEHEIERIVRVGFELAQARRKKLTSVDKANVMASSRLWRAIVLEVAPDYPDVAVEHLLVDACTMHLISRPGDFDVIVAENLFGDILSDEAVHAGRLDGHAAQRQPGPAQPRRHRPGHVRADPRHRARHPGPRHRQPHRPDPQRRDDAAPLAGPGGRGRRRRGGRRRCARRRPPPGRPRRPGRQPEGHRRHGRPHRRGAGLTGARRPDLTP